MAGIRKAGPCQYVWDEDFETTEERLSRRIQELEDENRNLHWHIDNCDYSDLWDSTIDYRDALREIATMEDAESAAVAMAALTKKD